MFEVKLTVLILHCQIQLTATQLNYIQHNDTHHYDIQHNDTRYKAPIYDPWHK
jgi:hypothetical protein